MDEAGVKKSEDTGSVDTVLSGRPGIVEVDHRLLKTRLLLMSGRRLWILNTLEQSHTEALGSPADAQKNQWPLAALAASILLHLLESSLKRAKSGLHRTLSGKGIFGRVLHRNKREL